MSDEMGWLRQIVDWQKEMQEPGEFLDSLRYDLASAEVYVFTPKGDVVALPSGATPVDFAYAVHTEVGHRCIGARVNGKLVALESELDNGDTVEVFTSKAEAAGPSRDWLGFVKSPRARNKIKQWFARERREDAIEAGKTALSKAMRKAALPQRVLAGDQLLTLAKDMHLVDVAALYAAIGDNHVSAQSVVQKLVAQLGGAEGAIEDIAEAVIPTAFPSTAPGPSGSDVGVVVKGVTGVQIKIAGCCRALPGDEILGFVTRGGGVSVHRRSCTNAAALLEKSERIVEVEWAPSANSTFVVSIQVEAFDRHGLLSDVTRVLSDERVSILTASVSTNRDRVAVSTFTFEMAEAKHLGHLLRAIKNVDGVYDAHRLHAPS
jgi:GTP pyrophosphokinase